MNDESYVYILVSKKNKFLLRLKEYARSLYIIAQKKMKNIFFDHKSFYFFGRLAILILFLMFFQKAPAQIKMILATPASNSLYISDLWNVHLINQSEEPFTIYMHGQIEETSEGLIFEGISDTLTIPGNKSLDPEIKNISEDNIIFLLPELSDSANLCDFFPGGTLTICTSIITLNYQEVLDKECIQIRITKHPFKSN